MLQYITLHISRLVNVPLLNDIIYLLACYSEALEHYDRERVTNNRGLTVTSQRKFVVFYERLWRDYWGVQGNLARVPGVPTDAPLESQIYKVS